MASKRNDEIKHKTVVTNGLKMDAYHFQKTIFDDCDQYFTLRKRRNPGNTSTQKNVAL